MDFDSIVYIIIAIAIAAINGFLQKKKKAEGKAPIKVSQPQQDASDINIEAHTQPYNMNTEEEENPLEILFGKSEHRASEREQTMPTAEINEPAKEDLAEDEAENTAKSARAKPPKKSTENDNEFLHEVNTFDFEEDGIAKSAIGNALTEEEEEQALLERTSDFEKNFNAKEAILYSEIINPKYF